MTSNEDKLLTSSFDRASNPTACLVDVVLRGERRGS